MDYFRQRWVASEYLDNGRWGVIAEDSTIIIGISAGLTEDNCRQIARYHNEKTLNLGGSAERGVLR